jgi:hypothetical protein
MRFDDFPANPEAKPCSLYLACLTSVDSRIFLEEPPLMLGGNAEPLIADGEQHFVWLLIMLADHNVDGSAGRRILDSIGDEILKNLTELVLVAPNIRAADIDGRVEAVAGRDLYHRHSFLDNCLDIDNLELIIQLAGLDLCD